MCCFGLFGVLQTLTVHALVVVLVVTGEDVLPPGLIVQIPLNGLLDAVSKLGLRQPAQLVVNLGGVDGVAHIVTLAVGNMDDEAFGLAQCLADELDDVDVLHLVVAAHIVDLTHTTLADDQVDGTAVILHIQPVTNVQTLAIDGQGLVVQGVGDHQGNQLLREVIGAVVVGAAADGHGQAVGAVIGHDQQVSTSLGGGVGAGGMNGGLLGEEEVGAVKGQVAIDLIGGNLMIALDAVLVAGVQQHAGAHDVGLQEDGGVFNGAVNMALSGKVHHDVGLLLLKELIDSSPVGDGGLDKAEVGVVHDAGQGLQIACVGQAVQTDDAVLRMSAQHIVDEVAADKTGAAGDNNRFRHNLLPRNRLIPVSPDSFGRPEQIRLRLITALAD